MRNDLSEKKAARTSRLLGPCPRRAGSARERECSLAEPTLLCCCVILRILDSARVSALNYGKLSGNERDERTRRPNDFSYSRERKRPCRACCSEMPATFYERDRQEIGYSTVCSLNDDFL